MNFKHEQNLRWCNGFESLLPGRVPDLSFYSASGLQSNTFRGELHANCRVLILWQLIFDVSAEKMRLSHTSVADKNH